jgi:hypothetical protein
MPTTAPLSSTIDTGRRTRQLELVDYGQSGRNLPNGMIYEVNEVLKFHGLDMPVAQLMIALAQVINRTPVAHGGRLLPDGTVDRG